MDQLQTAALVRARAAFETAFPAHDTPAAHAKAFGQLAYATLLGRTPEATHAILQAHANPLVQRAAAHVTTDAEWDGDARLMADAWVASIAPFSILDMVAKYATTLRGTIAHGFIASDSVANTVTEGAPKPIQRLNLAGLSAPIVKTAALVVMSQELARSPGGQALFEAELMKSVTRASNAAVLAELTDSSSYMTATEADPLAKMRAGIAAVGPSDGFVVAMPSGWVADLATRSENRSGMGVRGGEFVPGVHVVAVDTITAVYVIPASSVILQDGGLQVKSSGHASVDMRDTPLSPATLTSLFQTNSLGLLAERMFRVATGSPIAAVGGPLS